MMLLPPEIWSRVFSFFLPEVILDYPPKFATKPLQTLCLVSRQFRQIAQPFLFRTVFLTRRGFGQEPKLLRSLLEAPSLARAVRKVSLHDGGPNVLLPDHHELLKDVVRSLHVPEVVKRHFESAMENPYESPFLVFVLAMTTGVQEVDLAPYIDDEGSTILFRLLSGSIEENDRNDSQSHTNYPTYGLPCLKRMSLAIGDEMCYSISGLEPMLLRAGLESIRLSKIYWHWNEDGATQWPDGTSDLLSLSLHDSMINGYSVQDIFTRFPKLRSFSFTASDRFSGRQEDYADEDEDAEWGFRAAEVGQALRRFGTKLEELTLRTTTYRDGDSWYGHEWDESLLGSLQELHSLRKLEIDLSELTPNHDGEDCAVWAQKLVKILPSSLEDLIVPDCDGTLGKVLELVKGQHFHNLRQIIIVSVGRNIYMPSLRDEIPGWTMTHTILKVPWLEESYSFHKIN